MLQLARDAKGHEGDVKCAAALLHGGDFATASRDGTIRIWNADAEPKVLAAHMKESDDSSQLAACFVNALASPCSACVPTCQGLPILLASGAYDGEVCTTHGPIAPPPHPCDDMRRSTSGPLSTHSQSQVASCKDTPTAPHLSSGTLRASATLRTGAS